MLYKNKETGRVIDVNSEMGGAWEPVKAPKAEPKAEAPTKEAPKKGKK